MQNEMKKSKKILGAIFSSLAFGVFFLAMTFSITFFQFTEEEADEMIKRLAELEDKIESGKMIELPCKMKLNI